MFCKLDKFECIDRSTDEPGNRPTIAQFKPIRKKYKLLQNKNSQAKIKP